MLSRLYEETVSSSLCFDEVLASSSIELDMSRMVSANAVLKNSSLSLRFSKLSVADLSERVSASSYGYSSSFSFLLDIKLSLT